MEEHVSSVLEKYPLFSIARMTETGFESFFRADRYGYVGRLNETQRDVLQRHMLGSEWTIVNYRYVVGSRKKTICGLVLAYPDTKWLEMVEEFGMRGNWVPNYAWSRYYLTVKKGLYRNYIDNEHSRWWIKDISDPECGWFDFEDPEKARRFIASSGLLGNIIGHVESGNR